LLLDYNKEQIEISTHLLKVQAMEKIHTSNHMEEEMKEIS